MSGQQGLRPHLPSLDIPTHSSFSHGPLVPDMVFSGLGPLHLFCSGAPILYPIIPCDVRLNSGFSVLFASKSGGTHL